MEVDILVDKFTDCLVERDTGEQVETEYRQRSLPISSADLRIDGGVADVDIVETAPHNYGHAGRYQGVGGHLFAIACQVSVEAGCDGFVAFTAKSDLIAYYNKVLHAQVAGGQRMYIDDVAADILIEKYLRR